MLDDAQGPPVVRFDCSSEMLVSVIRLGVVACVPTASDASERTVWDDSGVFGDDSVGNIVEREVVEWMLGFVTPDGSNVGTFARVPVNPATSARSESWDMDMLCRTLRTGCE